MYNQKNTNEWSLGMLKAFIDSLHKWLKRKDLKKKEEEEMWHELIDAPNVPEVVRKKKSGKKRRKSSKGAFGK